MSTPCFRQSLRAFLLAALLLAAACSTSKLPDAPQTLPHYKIGEPYQINGETYTPREDRAYEAVGVASWYGDDFHGKQTANGETFDMRRLSAAHQTLPMPTLAEVENLANGRKVVLRVNDRGPFAGDRIIDVSHAAAIALGFEKEGLANVRVRFVGDADLLARAPLPRERQNFAAMTAPTSRQPSAPQRQDALNSAGREFRGGEGVVRPVNASARQTPQGPADPMEALIGTSMAAPAEDRGEFWILIAEFASISALERARTVLAPAEEARVVVSPGAGERKYGLQIGPYFSLSVADARLAALLKAGYSDAWIAGGRN